MSQAILIGESVRKVYHTGAEEVEALRGVNLTVAAGEFVAVMGPSGSGKTTLLNCFSGLDEIDGGRVLIDGESIHDLPDARRTKHRASTMGFVFQAFNLIPVFTALENVELPLLLAGVKERDARSRAKATLERVGLGHRLNHRPAELSGGEQQRVTVARALAGQPRIVWADEPTGNLDSETAGSVIDLLHELNKDGLTLVLVTHDESVAAGAHRTVHMRDGRIVQDGAGRRLKEATGRQLHIRTADGRRVSAVEEGRDGHGRIVARTEDGVRVVLRERAEKPAPKKKATTAKPTTPAKRSSK